MILLIIGVGMLNFLLPAPLNSIMFLLIPKSNSMLRSQYSSFKFHYVSIKSFASLSFTLSLNPLNSIMFLLILQNNHLTSLAYMPLNSIMFLLIPCLIYGQAYEKGTLNSIMFLLIRDSSEIPFDTIIL